MASQRWVVLQKARDRVGSKRIKQAKPVIIDALTDAATSLMTEDADAFELTREEIAHALQVSQVTAPQAQQAGRICSTAYFASSICPQCDCSSLCQTLQCDVDSWCFQNDSVSLAGMPACSEGNCSALQDRGTVLCGV